MNQSFSALGLAVITVLAGCSQAPGQDQAAKPAAPEACAEILAKPPPKPLTFDPGLAAVMGASFDIPAEEFPAKVNRLANLTDLAKKRACRDPRCAVVVSAVAELSMGGGQQKPLPVTCRDQSGTVTEFSYTPADLDGQTPGSPLTPH